MCYLCKFLEGLMDKVQFPELSQFVLLGKGLLLDESNA